MRHILTGLGVVIGLGIFATPSQAQSTGFSDPFFLYYGFYLPYQASRAAQPQPEDAIRDRAAGMQIQAQADRSALYDPQFGIPDSDLDPTRPFGDKRGRSRTPRTHPVGIVSGNLSGTGPAGYYTSPWQLFPHDSDWSTEESRSRGENRDLRSAQDGGLRWSDGIPRLSRRIILA